MKMADCSWAWVHTWPSHPWVQGQVHLSAPPQDRTLREAIATWESHSSHSCTSPRLSPPTHSTQGHAGSQQVMGGDCLLI